MSDDIQDILTALVIILLIICFFYFISKLRNNLDNNDIQINGNLDINTELLTPPEHRIFRRDNIDPNGLVRIRIFQKKKRKETPTKNKETPEKYFESLQEHDNDSQNVHNTQIISNLTKKYKRLMELNSLNQMREFIDAGLSMEEIKNAKIASTFMEIKKCSDIFNDDPENLKKRKINKVLNEIAKGNTITSISIEFENKNETEPIPIREDWILTLVWERIHHQDNKENTKKMEIALLDQLVECIQKNNDMVDAIMFLLFPIKDDNDDERLNDTHVVCINGRVARIISSLSLLDADPILQEPEKDEKELANLAYMKASSILQEELKKQNIEEIYIKNPETLTKIEKEKLEKFEKYVKDQIENILLQDYREILPEKKLKEIIQKSQAGV